MANILRIPANSEIEMMVIRDSVQDKFDVVDFVFDYINAAAFPTAWAYWKMEEMSGTRMDSSGNGHDWPSYNSPGCGTGKLGNALTSSTNSDGLRKDAPDFWPIDINTQFTISFWAKIAINGGIDFNTNMGIWLEGWAGHGIGGYISCNMNWIDIPYTYPADEWMFVVIYHDGTGLYLEINNTAVANSPGAHEREDDLGTTYVFGIASGAMAFDEVGIWLQALTPAQRSQLWNNGAGWSPY